MASRIKDSSVDESEVEVSEEQEEQTPSIQENTDEVDLESYSENLSSAQLSRLSTSKKAEAKPDISTLPNAIGTDGFPLFVKGDRIVIERRASFLAGNPYLDTRTYRVEAVDLVSGRVNLWDENLQQYALDNWRQGIKVGQVYKLSLGRFITTKGKRGRPRKEQATTVQPVATPGGQGEKKRRGRPPGVKNRSKETIQAEKSERAAAKRQRRG